MEGLYMFAIVPPPDLEKQIRFEQKRCSERYGTEEALKRPVHITLYEPFKAGIETETQFEVFHKWAAKEKPFRIDLEGFGFFEHPATPVVFIAPTKNNTLSVFRKGFVKQLKNYVDPPPVRRAYKPHFTIAYRDLAPEKFPAVLTEYSKRPFRGSFSVDSIFLWKHDGKRWHISREYHLGANSSTIQTELF
jgi:2'-5' RNA ligase